jgi:hypothetical protein
VGQTHEFGCDDCGYTYQVNTGRARHQSIEETKSTYSCGESWNINSIARKDKVICGKCSSADM